MGGYMKFNVLLILSLITTQAYSFPNVLNSLRGSNVLNSLRGAVYGISPIARSSFSPFGVSYRNFSDKPDATQELKTKIVDFRKEYKEQERLFSFFGVYFANIRSAFTTAKGSEVQNVVEHFTANAFKCPSARLIANQNSQKPSEGCASVFDTLRGNYKTNDIDLLTLRMINCPKCRPSLEVLKKQLESNQN